MNTPVVTTAALRDTVDQPVRPRLRWDSVCTLRFVWPDGVG